MSTTFRDYEVDRMLRVADLRVDGQRSFLGLGNTKPVFSWVLKSTRRDVHQSAYRIMVATSREALREGNIDLWDSVWVLSDRSFAIEYAGLPLRSRLCCWWAVEVRDSEGAHARSADDGYWEMGLLDPNDWTAQWLAVEDPDARADRDAGLIWIWGDAPPDVPVHRFRYAFDLPAAAPRTELTAVVRQTCLWSQITCIWLDGTRIAGAGDWVGPFPAILDAPPDTTVASLTSQHLQLPTLQPGRHVIAIEVQTRPVSSWPFASAETPALVPGLAALLRVDLETGDTLRFVSSADWTAHSGDSTGQWFEPTFDDASWQPARLRANETHQPWPPQPAMNLRQEFIGGTGLSRARLYVTALGNYEARLNGAKVGRAELTPGPAQYDKRIPYQVFDVLDHVRVGQNAVGLSVADGWYASYDGRFAWGPPPRRVLAQLELIYDDGRIERLGTGPDWRIAPSPVLSSQFKIGEIQDLRLTHTGWDEPGFDDRDWLRAERGDVPEGVLSPQSTAPIRIDRKIKPRQIVSLPNGDRIIDFGITIAGWCELIVRGERGSRIEIAYSEYLDPQGNIDPWTMYSSCGESRRDIFFLSGAETGDRLRPRFVYHGFRYVRIRGLDITLREDAAEAVVLQMEMELTGEIRAANPLIEDVFRLVVHTQKSNFLGIPLDNNTREVRGYNGEMAIYGETACYIMNASSFFANHVCNSVDGQNDDGTFPIYAPRPKHANVFPQAAGDAPGWGDTVIWLAWQCWRHYGDTSVIARHWDAMRRFSDFVAANNPSGLWLNKRVFDFSDWLSLEPTPPELFATAIWARTTSLLAECAMAIGRTADASCFHALRKRIEDAFTSCFVQADGTIGNDSQTSYVLALAFDLLPEPRRKPAVERLVHSLKQASPPALRTGTWGTGFLLDALADNGQEALAYDLLTSRTFPSWGYMLEQGATAIWENWAPGKGTSNQPALGAVAGFMFRRLAGIAAKAPGFREIEIRPLYDPRLEFAGGTYASVAGLISTDWRKDRRGSFRMALSIPPNTRATVHLPAGASDIMEGGIPILGKAQFRVLQDLPTASIIETGSGHFDFVRAHC